ADALHVLAGRGLTVILVAHGLGPMTPLVTRTLQLDDGVVTHEGPGPAGSAAPDAHHLDDEPGPAGLGLSG
ncbi:MAG: ABC transporter, partial [Actinomycetes bacterium]